MRYGYGGGGPERRGSRLGGRSARRASSTTCHWNAIRCSWSGAASSFTLPPGELRRIGTGDLAPGLGVQAVQPHARILLDCSLGVFGPEPPNTNFAGIHPPLLSQGRCGRQRHRMATRFMMSSIAAVRIRGPVYPPFCPRPTSHRVGLWLKAMSPESGPKKRSKGSSGTRRHESLGYIQHPAVADAMHLPMIQEPPEQGPPRRVARPRRPWATPPNSPLEKLVAPRPLAHTIQHSTRAVRATERAMPRLCPQT